MKILYWNYCGCESPATIRELRKLLTVKNLVIFLNETKLRANEFECIRVRCKMDDYFVVDLDSRKGGHYGGIGPRVGMDNFRKLALVDVKPDKGWFTWMNNGEGNIETCSDHDAALLDTLGRKPREDIRDPRLSFRFEACWAKENEAKDMIKRVWDQCDRDVIDKLMDGSMLESNIERFRASWVAFGCLYEEEWYWAQRGILQVAWDYFYSLFKIEACGNLERALVLIPNCITSNMNGALDSCVFDMELIEAFNQMDPHKLSGIDGLSSLFYKENCGVVGKDVLQLCYEAEVEALREGIIWAHMNVTRAFFKIDCIEWVSHSLNRVTENLCKLAVNNHCTFPFNMKYLSDIHGLVLADAC
ncbi:hypothetical protein GOBAR_DD00104 [Gossypium barbadense]|nr:hypothetical protein GOBAR_DD00104 [Gossypium barbadense]